MSIYLGTVVVQRDIYI